jgi:hypothetical protein
MLNKLVLSPDGDNDDSASGDSESSGESESRMLRALQALSSQPQKEDAESSTGGQTNQRPAAPFRQNQQGGREGFRGDNGFHANHANKGRHRFVKDGEVPVVHMSTPRPREGAPAPARNDDQSARLQGLLDEQRQRAELAERERNEGRAQLKSLYTKLAHAELTLADVQALAQARLDELEALRAQLAEPVTPPQVETDSSEQIAPPKRGPGRPRLVRPEPAEDAPPKRGPGRPRLERPAEAQDAPPKRGPGRPRRVPPAEDQAPSPVEHEPEPVQWWLAPSKGKRRV